MSTLLDHDDRILDQNIIFNTKNQPNIERTKNSIFLNHNGTDCYGIIPVKTYFCNNDNKNMMNQIFIKKKKKVKKTFNL